MALYASLAEIKSLPDRLPGQAAASLFYAILFLGNTLFAGAKAALIMTLLLFAANAALKFWVAALAEPDAGVTGLAIRSLFSLGALPIAWLICRAAAGQAAPWLMAVMTGAGGLIALAHPRPALRTAGEGKRWIIVAFFMLLALTWYPFSKIGAPLDGSYAYRAYFSSDYLKHFSVVEALAGPGLPPANLYFQGEALHYYWLPYATPAMVGFFAGSTPRAMFAFSFTVNFIFLLLLLTMAAKAGGRRWWLPYAAALLAVAPSLEGFYLWAVRAGFSLPRFWQIGRNTNIDGLTRWLWQLPEVDTLLRTLLFTPQHLLSLAFLLLFLHLQSQERERPWALSFCLAASLAASFFIGGVLLLSWGLYTLVREGAALIRGQRTFTGFLALLARHFSLPALLLVLSLALKMVTFGNSRIEFSPVSPGEALVMLGLNLGLLALAGLSGLLVGSFPGRGFHALLLTVSLAFILAMRIEYFASDISLKVGLIVILMLVLSACRLAAVPRARKLALPMAMLIVLPGLWTLALDVRNAADIGNRAFTSYVPFEEMRLLDWVRKNIPAARTVQNFPPSRPWNLSVIPAFSGRPMVVGDRMHGQIFQVRPELYRQRIEDLRRALAGLPATRNDLRHLGVDYLFWGADERRYFKGGPKLPVLKRLGSTVLCSLVEP